VICQFKKTFLRDLAELPAAYRKRIERLVFEEFPEMSNVSDKLDIRKMQGYENYFRIRIGDYRIGCEIKAGNSPACQPASLPACPLASLLACQPASLSAG